jgi:hypothetical protein
MAQTHKGAQTDMSKEQTGKTKLEKQRAKVIQAAEVLASSASDAQTVEELLEAVLHTVREFELGTKVITERELCQLAAESLCAQGKTLPQTIARCVELVSTEYLKRSE